MPEGPIIVILKEEVQLFKKQKVKAASCNNGALDAKLLEGQKVTDFKTWGKHFLICFPKFTVKVHLMMFGSYRVNSHTEKSARLHLKFSNGELNFYACQLTLIEQPLDEIYDWQTDIMNKKWNNAKAIAKMKEIPDVLACDALMDQHIFSGVGNIIKNEVLYRVKVHPESLVSALPTKKVKEMITEAVRYSFEFLEQKKAGSLNKHWQAYEQKICPRNHISFNKRSTGKSHRTSFYCEKCMVKYL